MDPIEPSKAPQQFLTMYKEEKKRKRRKNKKKEGRKKRKFYTLDSPLLIGITHTYLYHCWSSSWWPWLWL